MGGRDHGAGFRYVRVGHPDLGGSIGSVGGWIVIGLITAKLLRRASASASS
jgi:hypothetical protein